MTTQSASAFFTVLVCGSRDWTDWEAIGARLTDVENFDAAGRPVRLVHGAARGADELAARLGEGLGFEVVAYPADWERHGKRAGILRNLAMLDAGHPDLVLAFRLNGSRGTTHMIEAAKARGVPVEVIE